MFQGVFLMCIVSTYAMPNILQLNESDTVIIQKLFVQFRNHVKIIHFDNSSIDVIPTIVTNHTMILLNYDYIARELRMRKQKVPYIHLIINNVNILKTQKVSASQVNNIDIIFFLILKRHNLEKENLCLRPSMNQAKAVFIHDMPRSKSWYCCYYCGNTFSKQIQIVNPSFEIPRFLDYKNNYSNFNGYEFRVGYTEIVPFIFSL